MAERYTKLYTTESNLYKEGSPVILKAGALLLDTLNAKVLAQLKFQSITQKKIVALSVALQAQNTAGAPLGDAILHTYLELSVERNVEFGSQTPIYLPDAESRAFTAYVTKVEFDDHTFWETDKAGWEALVVPSRPVYELLQSPAAVEEYHRRFGANADMLPETVKDLWRCSCGAFNHREEERCHLCASKWNELRTVNVTDLEQEHFYLLALSLMECGDDASLKQAIEHFASLEDYKDSAEKKTACAELIVQHQAERKKAKKIGIIAVSIAAGIVACLTALFIGILPSVQINQATALVEAGMDAEAMDYLNNNCDLAEEFRPEQYHSIKNGIFSRATEEAEALVEKGKYVEAYTLLTHRQCAWGDTYELVKALNDKDYAKAVNEYGMTHITVPNSVTSIDSFMFSDCTKLTSITIPASVTSIGDKAFYNCRSLTSVTFDENSQLTSIGDYAFYECRSLTSVTFGENSRLTSIGVRAFEWCTSLTSITIPEGVTSIGSYAFCECTSLTSVTFGENSQCTSIGSDAFYYCYSLTSITIPASVTSIGSYAFSSCYSLTSITIPASVTSIGNYAFRYCYKLIEIYNLSSLNITAGSAGNGYVGYYAKNIYTATTEKSKLFTDSNGYLFYDDGTNRYLMGYTGTATELTLPASCNDYTYEIYQYAFYNRDDIVSITIPAGVTSIGDYAFYYCDSLTSITIPAGVTSIGKYAFSDCESLTSVTFENATGWWYDSYSTATSGTSISSASLANASTAATYLRSTYRYYYWKRTV